MVRLSADADDDAAHIPAARIPAPRIALFIMLNSSLGYLPTYETQIGGKFKLEGGSMSLLLKAGEFDAFDWFSSSVSFFGGAANRLMSFGWGKYTLAMKLPANDVRGGNAQMPKCPMNGIFQGWRRQPAIAAIRDLLTSFGRQESNS
jgi:hypothetical protein